MSDYAVRTPSKLSRNPCCASCMREIADNTYMEFGFSGFGVRPFHVECLREAAGLRTNHSRDPIACGPTPRTCALCEKDITQRYISIIGASQLMHYHFGCYEECKACGAVATKDAPLNMRLAAADPEESGNYHMACYKKRFPSPGAESSSEDESD